jgi:hypothetical protein
MGRAPRFQELGDRMRQERLRRGWGIKHAVHSLSQYLPEAIDYQVYRRLEAGERSYLRPDELTAIAECFGFDQQDVLAWAGYLEAAG